MKLKKYGVFMKMSKYHDKVLDILLNDPNAYLQVNNKLSIGITLINGKHIRVEKWNSNQELRDNLHIFSYSFLL